MRTVIKLFLIVIIGAIGSIGFGFGKMFGLGAIPLVIIAVGTIAAIRAIWKYNPESNEVVLNKDA
jgi:hypothetical protein